MTDSSMMPETPTAVETAYFLRRFADMMSVGHTASYLHHAAGLLKSTRLPVKVIAATIGFSSRSHFSRAFRDGYGVDPTAYRVAAVMEVQ